jgi:anti-anti-sigma regulatory factor
MWIAELLTRELSLDRVWRRLPHGQQRFDEILDLAQFTIIVNGAVLFMASFLAPNLFNVLDPIDGPDLVTFAISTLVVSLPVWCLTFGIRFHEVVRVRRSLPVAGPSGLWDDWLDGPAWCENQRRAVPGAGQGVSALTQASWERTRERAMSRDRRPIEVNVTDGIAVVTFPNTDWLVYSIDPAREGGQGLLDLVDRADHAAIILDFQNRDIGWLSCAFEGLLVGLHRRMSKKKAVLRLCNVPPEIVRQFTMNRLITIFHLYATLEEALDTL